MAFEIGTIFSSIWEVKDALEVLKQDNQTFWVRSSVLGTKSARHISKEIKYEHVVYQCIYGGPGRKCTNTYRNTGCNAHIRLSATESGQELQVVKVDLSHNHSLDPLDHAHLPQNNRLRREFCNEVLILLRSEMSNRRILNYIFEKFSKVMTRKTLMNRYKKKALDRNFSRILIRQTEAKARAFLAHIEQQRAKEQ